MKFTATHKMGIAALIMGVSVLLSRLMGLVRDKVISWQFGAGGEADVYFTAFVVPDFLNYLLAGGYLSITLIPLLTRSFEEDQEDGWRLFSAVFCWSALAMGALSLGAFLAAPWLAELVAPGFSEEQTARLTVFLRIILPAQIFFLPGACMTALLYIRRQFWAPALSPLVYNGCIILGGVLLAGQDGSRGMEGFCWGVLAGAALGAFALPFVVACRGGLRLRLQLRHRWLGRFLLLALPLMLGQSVVVLDEQFVRIFGSLAGDGAVSLLNYARRIMLVPVGVVAQAAGVASFPFLAALAARNDQRMFDETLRRALAGSFFVILPLSGWLIAVAEPVLGLVFEGGRFTAAQTLEATPLLRFMLLAVPFWAAQQIFGRAFYAREDTLTPALVGTAFTLAVVPLYPTMVRHFGASGVALLTSASLAGYALGIGTAWVRRNGTGALRGIGRQVGGCLSLTLLCTWLSLVGLERLQPGIASWTAALDGWWPGLGNLTGYACAIGLGGLIFALPYAVLARWLVPEALPLPQRLRRRG